MNQLSKRFCGIIIVEKIKRKWNKNGTKTYAEIIAEMFKQEDIIEE